MPEFRYFREPRGSNTFWTDKPRRCDLCGEMRPGYGGGYHGIQQIEFVCEPCLVSGRLAEGGFTTNDGDTGALAGTSTPEEIEGRRAELEERTPALITWEDWLWPVHCGDFCRFERQVGQRELVELAPDDDGARFLGEHLDEDAPLDWDWVPSDGDDIQEVGVYLFECLGCGRPLIRWDMS